MPQHAAVAPVGPAVAAAQPGGQRSPRGPRPPRRPSSSGGTRRPWCTSSRACRGIRRGPSWDRPRARTRLSRPLSGSSAFCNLEGVAAGEHVRSVSQGLTRSMSFGLLGREADEDVAAGVLGGEEDGVGDGFRLVDRRRGCRPDSHLAPGVVEEPGVGRAGEDQRQVDAALLVLELHPQRPR